MRASVNTSKKAIRDQMAKGCGPSPLCVPCGFRDKRVPAAWKYALPGTPYEADDPMIGERVTLRGDASPSVVVGVATPIGPGLPQQGRVSKRRECEGALLLRTPLGVVTPVTRSVVRERRRQESKPGRATCTCAGLPYPHREASSPLCELHSASVGELGALASDAWEDPERAEPRLIAAARRAAGKRGAAVNTADDARRVLEELQGRQAAMYGEAERRLADPKTKKQYKARVASAKRAARALGWDV